MSIPHSMISISLIFVDQKSINFLIDDDDDSLQYNNEQKMDLMVV